MAAINREQKKQVLNYLADRNRTQQGNWISVADVRGSLGIDRQAAEDACRCLGDAGLAEFMGGFPLRPTTGRFTLVRLTSTGAELAEDAARIDEHFGAGG
jgi:hypothetical protein